MAAVAALDLTKGTLAWVSESIYSSRTHRLLELSEGRIALLHVTDRHLLTIFRPPDRLAHHAGIALSAAPINVPDGAASAGASIFVLHDAPPRLTVVTLTIDAPVRRSVRLSAPPICVAAAVTEDYGEVAAVSCDDGTTVSVLVYHQRRDKTETVVLPPTRPVAGSILRMRPETILWRNQLFVLYDRQIVKFDLIDLTKARRKFEIFDATPYVSSLIAVPDQRLGFAWRLEGNNLLCLIGQNDSGSIVVLNPDTLQVTSRTAVQLDVRKMTQQLLSLRLHFTQTVLYGVPDPQAMHSNLLRYVAAADAQMIPTDLKRMVRPRAD